MDDRLQKALEFSNYNLTITNQKKNIKNRVNQIQIVHHNGGVFLANPVTISFVKTLIDLGQTASVIVDTKENPIEVKNLQEFIDLLLDAYTSAMQEYQVEYDKIKKARNIKTVMGW